MGTVTKSIGTAARDYSLPQSWEDALPANLVTDGNAQRGVMYNDSEFTSTLVISGQTTNSTNNITVTCATGNSFRDNASKATNRLTYNQANGVGIRTTAGYGAQVIQVSTANTLIDGLQIKATGTGTPGATLAGSGTIMQNCIVSAVHRSNVNSYVVIVDTCMIRNCLVIANSANTMSGVLLSAGAKAINCTLVRPSNFTAGGKAWNSVHGTNTVRNCLTFGFTDTATGTYAADGHNASDMSTTPGSTSNLVSQTYANFFEQSSAGGSVEDFRLKTGSPAINAGVTDTTDIPTADDIIGTARSSWDIGCWEFGSSVQTYSYTATGGMTVAGTAPTVKTITRAVSGGMVLTGTAAAVRGIFEPTPTGGINLAGTSAMARGRGVTPSGGLSFSGAADFVRTCTRAITGGVTFSGTSPMDTIKSFVYTAVGGFSLSGVAAFIRTCTRAVSGGFTFSGTSPYENGNSLTSISSWIIRLRRLGRR